MYTAFWAEKDSAGNDKVDADGKQTFVSLPTWIVFDGLKRRFTFEPDKSWHAGRHTLRVVGTEKGISGKPTPKSAFAEFVLDVEEVNDAPVASTPTEQKVVEDTTSTYRFDVFTDEEDDAAGVPLKYRAFWASKDGDGDGEDVVNGAGEKVFVDLPEWIPFDRETRTFTFLPKEDSHAGVHTLRVVGEDAGIGTDAATKKRSHADFVLRVESVNDAPVASTLVDQKVAEDVGSTYVFDAFEDEETPSSALTYSAHLLIFPSSSAEEVFFEGSPASEETSSGEERSSGSEGSVRSRRDSSARAEVSLPDWISFDGGRRLFRFSPETGAHVGRHALRVRGRDASGKTETADFALRVSATNDAPEADVSIEGSLEEGRVVHLRVAGLSDEDGVPSSSKSHRYRWYESSEPEVSSSWSLISGAESASFRLGSGQAGKYLRGVFSYMDSGGTRERVFAQSEEVVRRKSLPSVVVPIFGGEKESSSSSVSVSEEGEALEMVSLSLSQAQERLSLMRNRRGSGSGVPSLPPPRFSLPPVLSEPRVQPPSSQGSGVQAPQSPQAQGTTTQQSGGASSQPSSQPPGSQGSGSQIPQSPQAQGTSAQQGDGASSQPSSQPRGSQGSGVQAPQSPQPQGTSARQSDGASSQPSSQPPGSQGGGAQVPQSPQAQGTSAQQSDGASSQPSSQPPTSQGSGAQAPQSPQAQGTSAQQSDGASSQPSSQPPGSQGSGAQVSQSPQAQGTSAQQSDAAPSQQPVSSDTPSQSDAPAQQNLPVEQSADAQTQSAQGAAEQIVAEDAEEQEVGEDAPEQEVVDEVAEDVSEQVVAQDATPSPSTPVSRKTDSQSDTELRKDLGGSELPTPVRLSPHDIHTEITFISEDEVDVQLSLAEGAPMEISMRALAAQLTGDDAVRIEILDLPEGLRFDRETGMLEDALGMGLSADGVAEVRVMLTDAQGRRMTVTLQVLSVEGLSQPEADPKLEGRTQTDDRTGSDGLGGGRPDVGDSSDGADEGEGSEGSDSVEDAALEELSGDKEARSSSGSAGALSSEGFFANFLGKGGLRLRSLSLSDFFLDLFRGFSSEKEIVLSRDISSGSADGDGEVSQTPSRSSLETQVAELGVHGRARSLVASLRDLGSA